MGIINIENVGDTHKVLSEFRKLWRNLGTEKVTEDGKTYWKGFYTLGKEKVYFAIIENDETKNYGPLTLCFGKPKVTLYDERADTQEKYETFKKDIEESGLGKVETKYEDFPSDIKSHFAIPTMKQETEENIDYENNEHCKVVAGDTPFDTFKNYYSTLRKGNRSDFTTELQHMLNKVGYGINIDGIFGNDTKNAVKSFQKSKGLKQDGIVGKMTWNTFVKTISEDSETKNQ